jgi:hypothetical protein
MAESMRRRWLNMSGLAIALLISAGAWAQQTPPVQPPGEAEIARQFEEQAPDLFQQWLKRRPAVLQQLAFGRWNETDFSVTVPCPPDISFTFSECSDVEVPTDYKINVRKTDSILTPYIGELLINVKVRCRIRHLFPPGFTFSIEKYREAATLMAGSCIGKRYEDCAAAGAKPREKAGFFGCSGREANFSFDDEAVVTYRWSHEKWEFQEDKVNKSVPSASGQTMKKSVLEGETVLARKGGRG